MNECRHIACLSSHNALLHIWIYCEMYHNEIMRARLQKCLKVLKIFVQFLYFLQVFCVSIHTFGNSKKFLGKMPTLYTKSDGI